MKIKPKRGDVFRVPLEAGMHGYGHILDSVLQGFYAVRTDRDLALEHIVEMPVAFRLYGMADRIRTGDWPVIGNIEPRAAMELPFRVARRTTGGGFFLLSEWTPEASDEDRRVSADEVKGLERDTIWDSYAVRERLEMFFRGEQHPRATVF